MKIRKMLLVLFCSCLFIQTGCSNTTSNNPSIDSSINSSIVQSNKEELDYVLSNNNTGYVVTGIGSYKSNKIIIPTEYNGLPIIGIRNNAFEECESIISVEIPQTVTKIGKNAFYRCTSLESISLPFIGAELNGTSNTHFGYIFGASKYSDNSSYVPNSLKEVIITSGTSIENNAFYGCFTLTSIIIPSSITSIGNDVFKDCNSLKYNEYQNGLYLGSDDNPYLVLVKAKDTNLMEIEVSDSTKYILNNAFSGCNSLASIKIPNSVISIGDKAFDNCNSLQYNEYGNCLYLGNDENPNLVLVKAKDTTIQEATISNETRFILNKAFFECISLPSITIPNSVSYIDRYAFSGCTLLNIYCEVASKPSGWISSWNESNRPVYWGINKNNYLIQDEIIYVIEDGNAVATGHTKDLSNKVVIPSTIKVNTKDYNVTKIVKGLFLDCSSLESITLPFVGAELNGTNNTHFGYIFGATNYNDNSSYVPSSLKEVIITGGKSIETSAFFGCSTLILITIPNSVLSIGYEAFSGCSSIKSLTLPFIGAELSGEINMHFGYIFGASTYDDNIKKIPSSLREVIITGSTFIGERAFCGCGSLTSVTIPNSVTSIGNSAFSGCSSLTSIVIPNSVTSIGSYAFSRCSSLTIYCEANSKPSGWISSWNESNRPVYWKINNYNYMVQNGLQYIVIDGSAVVSGHTSELSDKVAIPSSISFSGTTYIVNSIGKYAFYNCSSLTSITIPNSVTSIGEWSFYGCSSLTSITIPNSVTSIGNYAFSGCSSLTSIVIPNSVTSIGESAFYDCNSLKSITLPFVGAELNGTNYTYFGYIFKGPSGYIAPNSLKEVIIAGGTSIGERAFWGCGSLTSVTIPNSVTSIGESAFEDCSSLTSIVIPNSVTSIGNSAFSGCSSLTSIVIPNSVTSIGDYAFVNCSSLTSIDIPNSVTSIGYSAFWGCSSLTSVTIPNSVTSIGKYAFCNCSSLTSITIPNSVTSIGESAFEDCSSLTSIVIPNSVTIIGNSAFCGCSSLTSIEIPSSVTSIGYCAFGDCSSLTSIVIPNSVTSIGNSAFSGCSSLTSIVIPNSVTSIGDYAFVNCSSLTSIDIPNSVTSIGYSAFWDCSSLTSVTIPNSVTSIGNRAFSGCSSLTIYCEANSKPDGWNSSWNESNRPVYWAGEWTYIDGVPTPLENK